MQIQKKVTILEIAKACGISKTTVACALNAHTAGKVSAEKTALITATANRLGYVPNRAAQMMRSRRNYAIGIMLPEPGNSFYGRMVLSLQKQLARKGYTALFAFWNTADDAGNINQALNLLTSQGVDGIITCGLPGVHFENLPVPVVFWQVPPNDFDSVSTYPCIQDVYRELIRLLKDKGCRDFAMLAPSLDRGRTRLVLDVLKEEGVSPRPEHCFNGIISYETANAAMEKILSLPQRPEVILSNNDAIAMGAMSSALHAGVKIPDEMKFVGYDGVEEARYFFPSLTTFSVPVEEAAEKLLMLLFRRMENQELEPMNLQVEPQLIIGGSI